MTIQDEGYPCICEIEFRRCNFRPPYNAISRATFAINPPQEFDEMLEAEDLDLII